MSTFSNPTVTKAQIGGGCGIVISLILGILGVLFLKYNVGLPEYMICLRNTGWSLLIIGIVWTGLATWNQAKH